MRPSYALVRDPAFAVRSGTRVTLGVILPDAQ
jgi:hypothetical protein